MADFKIELIRLIETNVPQLKDKIQHAAVDAQTQTPYAAFQSPTNTPIRSIHGIVGYVNSFEISVIDKTLMGVELLRDLVISALERATIDSQVCRLSSFASAYYADYDLHGYVIKFTIK